MVIPPDDALADDGTLFWFPFQDERLTLLDQGTPGDLTTRPTYRDVPYHPCTSRSHLPFSDREFSKLLIFRSKHWEKHAR